MPTTLNAWGLQCWGGKAKYSFFSFEINSYSKLRQENIIYFLQFIMPPILWLMKALWLKKNVKGKFCQHQYITKYILAALIEPWLGKDNQKYSYFHKDLL